jgi:maleylacetate reductase
VPVDTVRRAVAAAEDVDGVVALGGGSAIDTGKAVSAATGLPLVSIPTTYSGAEWTSFFGIRDEERREKGGGSGANLAGIVYEPKLTLGLPRAESGGTALNALAHSAEALYVPNRSEESDTHALAGAGLIDGFLPAVLADGNDLETRAALLRGAAHAGEALGLSGLALGHAMAQALGGRYGIPHGAANALCLPPALRFNAPVAGPALERLAGAMGVADAAARCEELARLGGFERLRDLGVPAGDLDVLGEATAVRGGARVNPRPASAAEIAELFRSIW